VVFADQGGADAPVLLGDGDAEVGEVVVRCCRVPGFEELVQPSEAPGTVGDRRVVAGVREVVNVTYGRAAGVGEPDGGADDRVVGLGEPDDAVRSGVPEQRGEVRPQLLGAAGRVGFGPCGDGAVVEGVGQHVTGGRVVVVVGVADDEVRESRHDEHKVPSRGGWERNGQ
jgi:hypothetical protein